MVVGIFNAQNDSSGVSRVGIRHEIFKSVRQSNITLVSGSVKRKAPPYNCTHLLIANPDRNSPAQFILVTDTRDADNSYSTLSIQVVGDSNEALDRHIKEKVSSNDYGFRPLAWLFRPTQQLEAREPIVAEHVKDMRPMIDVSKLVYDDMYRFSEASEALSMEIMGDSRKEQLMSERVVPILRKAIEKNYFSENNKVNEAIVELVQSTMSRKMGLIPRGVVLIP